MYKKIRHFKGIFGLKRECKSNNSFFCPPRLRHVLNNINVVAVPITPLEQKLIKYF